MASRLSRFKRTRLGTGLFMGLALGLSAAPAQAADVTPLPPPVSWWDKVEVGGSIDAGLTLNPSYPADGVNFGRLFTDVANRPVFNQGVITVQRPIDSDSKDIDLGFKFQFMYGSDARYSHFLGALDYTINDLTQITFIEAYMSLHLPWIFQGGIDIKGGQFVTLAGAEFIYAPDNLLYSHSYIFNFGPFQHTGILTTSHVTPWLDVYAGVTAGLNTSIGYRVGDNNGSASFLGGFSLNLFDGDLTILAATSFGPEYPDTPATRAACLCNPNTAPRFLNGLTVTWKATEWLTLISDADYLLDNATGAEAFGIAQYAAVSVNDWLKLIGRAEVWRDTQGFFAAAYPGNFDLVNAAWGFPNNAYGAAPTTYLELTGGLNISPTVPQGLPFVKTMTFRPEIRYDRSLSGTTPFNVGTASSQFTFGGDIILTF
jgi:hypothetical protein